MTPALNEERVEAAVDAARITLRGLEDARASDLTRGEIASAFRAAITAYLGDTHVVVRKEKIS